MSKCRHKATHRISSHADLLAAAKSGGPMASTEVCYREGCQADATEWVKVVARVESVTVTGLRTDR